MSGVAGVAPVRRQDPMRSSLVARRATSEDLIGLCPPSIHNRNDILRQTDSSFLHFQYNMEHLSEVVQALCDASDDTIRRFLGGIERSKLRLATERLQCAESSADTRHPRIPTAAQSTPETNKLAERLIARTQELEQFFTRSVEVAVGEPPWLEEDYRIVDIRLAPGGKQRGSLRADFRRALGERSLASDFDAHDPTRLEEILQSKTFILTRGRRSANSYSSFLRQGNFPEDTQRVAREAISVGLKYLAVERSEPTLGLGISALLAFAHEPLKTIELGTLLDTIRSSEFAHLRALALRIPEWMSQAQNLYATQSQLHSVERSLKRRCATTDKDSRLGPPQSSIDVLAAVATGSLNSVATPMPALDICTADSSCQVQQLSAPGLLNNNGPPRQSSGTLSLEPGCSAYDDSASSAFHQGKLEESDA